MSDPRPAKNKHGVHFERFVATTGADVQDRPKRQKLDPITAVATGHERPWQFS